MKIDAPLTLHRETVRPEWLDYNGHMNEAYYVLVFSHATDAFMDYMGQDAAYRTRSNTSVYTLETHVTYLREAHEGEELRVETTLLGHDSKRYRLFHAMYSEKTGEMLATGEHMSLHVDMAGPRSAPFADELLTRLSAIREAHENLPVPSQAGRAIALPRERA